MFTAKIILNVSSNIIPHWCPQNIPITKLTKEHMKKNSIQRFLLGISEDTNNCAKQFMRKP